jgi:DNA-binding beta-propeller fold protein YncE
VLRIALAVAMAMLPAVAAVASPRSAGSATVHHYEYVFPVGGMYLYDMDEGQKLVQEVHGLPDTDGVRGVMVNPATHVLYISHGSDGGSVNGKTKGSLLAYDLVSGTVLWNHELEFPIDSGALSADGKVIYMPTGENDASGIWNVIDATSGEPTGAQIKGGAGAHNTIVSLDGKYVFLGGRSYNYLDVASTATDEVVRKIGPLVESVRPFTVNGADTLAFTTATKFLGFQVSSITTGKVLYTVSLPELSPEFGLPGGFPLTAPSHGITLTPDEKRLYVFDAPNEYVHVFDVSGLPAKAPALIASIKIAPSIAGKESPCGYDCNRSGWLQASRDGRFVYVGDSGDVIDTGTQQVVAKLAALQNTRELLEIDWANGAPVATTTRYGLGYVMPGSGPPPGEEGPPPGKEGPPPAGGSGKAPPPGGGPQMPPPVPSPTVHSGNGASATGAPAIRGLQIAPSAFLAASRGASIARAGRTAHAGRTGQAKHAGAPTGARIGYTDSAAASTTFTVLARVISRRGGRGCKARSHRRTRRRPSGCVRYVSLGSFTHVDLAGHNELRFSGRLDGHALAPGRYRLQAVPMLGGRAGEPASASFAILG